MLHLPKRLPQAAAAAGTVATCCMRCSVCQASPAAGKLVQLRESTAGCGGDCLLRRWRRRIVWLAAAGRHGGDCPLACSVAATCHGRVVKCHLASCSINSHARSSFTACLFCCGCRFRFCLRCYRCCRCCCVTTDSGSRSRRRAAVLLRDAAQQPVCQLQGLQFATDLVLHAALQPSQDLRGQRLLRGGRRSRCGRHRGGQPGGQLAVLLLDVRHLALQRLPRALQPLRRVAD